MPVITDNIEVNRFELTEEGKLAFATYHVTGRVISLLHVESDPALRGHGTAGRLMEGLLEIVRRRKMKVRPVCGYAASYIRRHDRHTDLLETGDCRLQPPHR